MYSAISVEFPPDAREGPDRRGRSGLRGAASILCGGILVAEIDATVQRRDAYRRTRTPRPKHNGFREAFKRLLMDVRSK
jgi:hypothetical protein